MMTKANKIFIRLTLGSFILFLIFLLGGFAVGLLDRTSGLAMQFAGFIFLGSTLSFALSARLVAILERLDKK